MADTHESAHIFLIAYMTVTEVSSTFKLSKHIKNDMFMTPLKEVGHTALHVSFGRNGGLPPSPHRLQTVDSLANLGQFVCHT